MGMSASQARLLSITARMNDIEFKSQQVSNVKIRLADDSEKVANAYTAALNKQKFSFSTYDDKGNAVKFALNSSTIAQAGFKLMKRGSSFTQVGNVNKSTIQTLAAQGKRFSIKLNSSVASERLASVEKSFASSNVAKTSILSREGEKQVSNPVFAIDNPKAATLNSVYELLDKGEVASISVADSNVPTKYTESQLYEMIESGEFYLVDASGKEVSVSGNVKLIQESDTTELAKAEAEYNAATAKINKKEKQLDNEMKSLDTEHNALKTEFDSVKSLIGENVEKTFNLFS